MLCRGWRRVSFFNFPSLRSHSGQPVIETLEGRKLFSAGNPGVVVGERLIGAETACTGIVLTFNEHLNAASAKNVKAYEALRLFGEVTGSEPAKPPAGVVSIRDASPDGGVDSQKVVFVSAAYNDTNLTVTLTPSRPFDAQKYLNVIRVAGIGSNAVLDTTGQPIDGNGDGTPGGDAVIKFSARKGRRISYHDAAGDKVILNLTGPGTIHALFQRTGDPAPIVFIVGANSSKSVLTGTVLKGIQGAGVAVIQELTGTATFQDNLSNNPFFDVQTTQP